MEVSLLPDAGRLGKVGKVRAIRAVRAVRAVRVEREIEIADLTLAASRDEMCRDAEMQM